MVQGRALDSLLAIEAFWDRIFVDLPMFALVVYVNLIGQVLKHLFLRRHWILLALVVVVFGKRVETC